MGSNSMPQEELCPHKSVKMTAVSTIRTIPLCLYIEEPRQIIGNLSWLEGKILT